MEERLVWFFFGTVQRAQEWIFPARFRVVESPATAKLKVHRYLAVGNNAAGETHQ